MSLTARIADWSAGHWKTVVTGWIVLVVALALVAGHVGTHNQTDLDQMTGESQVGARMLADAGLEADAGEVVLITSRAHAAASADAAALAARIAERVRAFPGVSNVQFDAEELVAADDAARIVTFDLDEAGGVQTADLVGPIRAAVTELDAAHDGFRVQQFGDASIDADIGELVGSDLGRAETLTAPVTLVILFLTFGALVAAGLPLLIGGVSVFAALSLGSILSHLLPQSEFAPNVVSMLGIALGVDYTLFLLRREREERAAGYGRREAIVRAAATSGSAVVVSGITVIVAMSGLLVSGVGMFVSMGFAAMLVVAMVLLAALFVVPALLGVLGDGVERGRLPRLTRRRRAQPRRARTSDSRFWGAVVRIGVRRPGLTVVLVGALLVGACLPVLGMETGDSTTAELPRNKPALAALAAYEPHFPGGAEPAKVVVRDDSEGATGAARIERAFTRLERRALAAGATSGPGSIRVSEDGRTHLLSVPLVSAATRAGKDHALLRLRRQVGQTVGAMPSTTVAVAGSDADSHDYTQVLAHHLPLVFLVVLGSAFVLLMCAFRSVVVPLVAVTLNLLSVGAAYGFLVWGFQNRHLAALLPIGESGVVVSWMPMFLFALLFGLSMDYHVFMISRIREQVARGTPRVTRSFGACGGVPRRSRARR
ncbi:MAG: anti-sigma-factor antagonist [Thermoleophilia bacterium]|nr:anti-sigma-factor antagonist [Thermoleophilia bacterium]